MATTNGKILAIFTFLYLAVSSMILVYSSIDDLEQHQRQRIKRDESAMDPSKVLFQWLESFKSNYEFSTIRLAEGMISSSKSAKYIDDEAQNAKCDHGDYHGVCQINYRDGSWAKANFTHGILHGLFVRYQCQFGPCDQFDSGHAWSQPRYLKEISVFVNGFRHGISYQFKTGGGFVVGKVDHKGELTGPDIAYIYPDLQTMIVGRFQNGELRSGYPAELVDIDYHSTNGLLNPIARLKSNSEKLYHSPSNQTFIPYPLTRDYMEDKFIYVAASTLSSRGAGRGVFLKRNCLNGTVVGFYNGVRMTNLESKVKTEDRKSAYRMDNDWATPTQILNIPAKYRDLNSYNATLGHLVNHQTPPNVYFGMIDHPRFGKVRSLVLLRDMKAGEELFVDYGYVESYASSDAAIKAIYKATQWWMNENDKDFHQNLKYHIKYMRKKVDQFKPYLKMFKTLTKML